MAERSERSERLVKWGRPALGALAQRHGFDFDDAAKILTERQRLAKEQRQRERVCVACVWCGEPALQELAQRYDFDFDDAVAFMTEHERPAREQWLAERAERAERERVRAVRAQQEELSSVLPGPERAEPVREQDLGSQREWQWEYFRRAESNEPINQRGMTRLSKAAAQGTPASCRALVEQGADVNLAVDWDGVNCSFRYASPLLAAAMRGDGGGVGVVAELLRLGADARAIMCARDPLYKDGEQGFTEGWTVLMSAVSSRRLDVVKLIVATGVDAKAPATRYLWDGADVREIETVTALDIARKLKLVYIINFLDPSKPAAKPAMAGAMR